MRLGVWPDGPGPTNLKKLVNEVMETSVRTPVKIFFASKKKGQSTDEDDPRK